MTRMSVTSAVLMMLLSPVFATAQTASGTAHRSSRSASQQEDRELLEQLSTRVKQLEAANAKYGALQQQVDELKKQLQDASRTAAGAQQAASEAKQQLTELTGRNEEAVGKLQSAVTDLGNNSASFAATLQENQAAVKTLESPDGIHFKGIKITPGGFTAAETVWRQRGIGGDINTSFATIPFAGQTAAEFTEFNFTARQSRISMLAEGKLPKSSFRGYFETDFLSAGTTSNDNQSNSYALRIRQAWGQAQLASGWDITAGQMWSLATENKVGIANLQEAIPLTIDSQYTVGFTWERQYAFRAVKRLGNQLWLGGSVEAAQTLNIGGHNLPTILYQQPGNAGGLYSPTANYSYNYAPDLLAKIAYQPGFGHFELFAIGRFFRDRVFPNGPPPPGAPQPPTTSALGAFTSRSEGGGVGANARVWLLSRSLELGAHIL